MKIPWFLLVPVCCATLAVAFDLGPYIRISQCRSECLRNHSIDNDCDANANCSALKCWQICEVLEKDEKSSATICNDESYTDCPSCRTACTYRDTRVAEKYEPSMLPAPNKGPVFLGPYDVAVVLRVVNQEWREFGYYYSKSRVLNLRPSTWIIVVTEKGPRHYSWEEWVPTLDSLKEGPLYEATISWRDMRQQLLRQQEREQKLFKDRRQSYLETYGERVLSEWREHEDEESRKISRDVFRRFFFMRRDESSETDGGGPFTKDEYSADNRGAEFPRKKQFVVTWGPETGGLTGNQVTDGDSAQISLLPGTKYLVRVTTNDGPGSFPIIVDTRPALIDASFPASSSSFSSSSSSSSSSSVSSVPLSHSELKNYWRKHCWRLMIINLILITVVLFIVMKCYCSDEMYLTIFGKSFKKESKNVFAEKV